MWESTGADVCSWTIFHIGPSFSRTHVSRLVIARLGAKRVLIAGLLVQALAAGTYAWVSRLSEFYAVAFVFGLAYGGPALGGWIFDTFHGYAWLYIGSLAVGLGAAAIALAFPAVSVGGPHAAPQAA